METIAEKAILNDLLENHIDVEFAFDATRRIGQSRTNLLNEIRMPQSRKLDQRRLTQSQVRRYWDDGFLFPIRVMDRNKAQSYRERLEQLETDWLDNGLTLPLNTYKRINSHVVMTMAAEIASEPTILDVVGSLIGPNIMVYSAEFFVKEPKTTHVVTMHQDLTYWGFGATDNLVTAWLALSDVNRASGCMDFVAGSHKNEILPHLDSDNENNLLSRGQEVQVNVAEDDKTAIELQPGQISLHHGLTIHGSGPNVSDDRRIGFVIRYARPEISQKVGERDYGMLVRGTNQCGNLINVAPPAHDFAPESLEIYDEIRRHQAEIMMNGAKTRDKGLYG